MEQQLSEGGQAVVLARPDAAQIAGMLGAGTAIGSVLCLLLARYWQAALYNPGGFGQEFRALYYPPVVARGWCWRRWCLPVRGPSTAPGR